MLLAEREGALLEVRHDESSSFVRGDEQQQQERRRTRSPQSTNNIDADRSEPSALFGVASAPVSSPNCSNDHRSVLL